MFLDQIRQEQLADLVIRRAKHLVETGKVILQGRFKRIQNQLCVEGNILTKSGRLIVLALLRKFILNEIHNVAHFGTDKTYSIV